MFEVETLSLLRSKHAQWGVCVHAPGPESNLASLQTLRLNLWLKSEVAIKVIIIITSGYCEDLTRNPMGKYNICTLFIIILVCSYP